MTNDLISTKDSEDTDVNKPAVTDTTQGARARELDTGGGARRRRGSPLLRLSDDALFWILRYCDVQSLGRLSRVCRRLNQLARHDSVWLRHGARFSVINESRNFDGTHKRSAKERCRLAVNWETGTCRKRQVIFHKISHMPCMQRVADKFWVSYKNIIYSYTKRSDNGDLKIDREMIGHHRDVCHFVIKGNTLVSSGRVGAMLRGFEKGVLFTGENAVFILSGTGYGSVCIALQQDHSIILWNADTGLCEDYITQAHTSDINCVDFLEDTVISGSKDTTVKIWKQNGSSSYSQMKTLDLRDRVWSVLICADNRSVITGSAGCNQVAPLQLWDLERGMLSRTLGSHFRHGAGVRDIQHHSAHTVLSCGYDTILRLWDLRTRCDKSVKEWVDPFDSTIYCARSDGANIIVSGTARHGLVWLWDVRMNKPVTHQYTSRSSSPVYSLTFDPSHLHVALDRGVSVVDFGVLKKSSDK